MTKHLCFFTLILICLYAEPVAAQSGIRGVDFRNFSYPFKVPSGREPFRELGHVVNVRNGVAHAGEGGNPLSYLYFKVAEVLYGDLTGDGQDDAAVVAIYGSGSGDFYLTNVYFYTLRGGRPSLLATLTEEGVSRDYRGRYSGDGQNIFEAIEGGRRIHGGVFSSAHLADGAHCCPVSVATLTYRLRGKHLELAGIRKRKFAERDERMKASYDR